MIKVNTKVLLETVKNDKKLSNGAKSALSLALNRLIELEDKLENGQLVELPCTAMIEQGIVDGVFKPTKEAQQFNGRYAVVYIDKHKYGKPLIDVCWSKYRNYALDQAEARLKKLQEK